MANEEHLAILKQGVEVWNQWRKQNIDLMSYLRSLDPDLAALFQDVQPAEEIRDAFLSSANSHKIYVPRANFNTSDFRAARLNGVDFFRANLISTNFEKAILADANLIEADLRNANLKESFLSRAQLRNATLSRADLRKANLFRADLREANLYTANLSGSRLEDSNFSRANLRKAILSEADLRGVNLQYANLTDADLTCANLYDADIHHAPLVNTDFTSADLKGANLSNADLTGAIFNGANFIGADLSGAIFNEANFTDAVLGWTSLGDVDLSEVKGLDTVTHNGPSTIGIDTIYRSQGKIPESFLRGAGVPDDFITYIDSFIASKSIDFYSCFISYSDLDRSFAERLHADLRGKSVRCWYAPEDMRIGSKIRQTINEAIRLRDKLLVVLSEHSLASAWVEDEVEAAFEEEIRRQKTVLFPVRLDDTVMESNKAWASKLRQRHIGDFRQWKHHDEYEAAFDRLLRDLRAEEEGD